MSVASGRVVTVSVEKMPSPRRALTSIGSALSTTMTKLLPLWKPAIPMSGGSGIRIRLVEGALWSGPVATEAG
ncbi:hypothetical protein, partial [Komagataeibacter kakiaceti]|uniref:hypothetical protein n=1 Tax=Komagataeibacter kakiaceti TaxID=943261 RepID=UPI001A7E5AC1